MRFGVIETVIAVDRFQAIFRTCYAYTTAKGRKKRQKRTEKGDRNEGKIVQRKKEKGPISDHILALLSVPAKRVATFYIMWLRSRYAVMLRRFADICIHTLSRRETHGALFEECLARAVRCFRNGHFYPRSRNPAYFFACD